MHSLQAKRPLHLLLLEMESVSFTQNNLTVRFKDPILHLPDVGKVILRSTDFEYVISVPNDCMITIPFELLAYKTTIQVIFLHPSGKTVTGDIHITGKTVCTVGHQ